MIGRNVTVDTICLRIDRISAWISASGFGCALRVYSKQKTGGVDSIRSDNLQSSGRSVRRWLFDQMDVKDPAFDRRPAVLGYDCYYKL